MSNYERTQYNPLWQRIY